MTNVYTIHNKGATKRKKMDSMSELLEYNWDEKVNQFKKEINTKFITLLNEYRYQSGIDMSSASLEHAVDLNGIHFGLKLNVYYESNEPVQYFKKRSPILVKIHKVMRILVLYHKISWFDVINNCDDLNELKKTAMHVSPINYDILNINIVQVYHM